MKEYKESKIRARKKNSKKRLDTLSITRELEKTLITNIINEQDKSLKKKRLRKISAILLAIILTLGVGGYVIWLNSTYESNEYANHALLSSNKLKITKTDNDSYIFEPLSNKKNIGIVIVPAQKVKPKSYSRFAKELANKGYSVYIPKLVLNSSVFSKGEVEKVLDSNKDISKWYLVSHADSGNTVQKIAINKKDVAGVIFLGSYVQGDELKLINKPSLLVWGTKDGVLDFTKFDNNKKNLPVNTKYNEIVGGNNTNFADMELMEKDNKATITAEDQQTQTVNTIIEFIQEKVQL